MTLTINGTDPRTLCGLVIAEVTGWADDAVERYPTIAVPGRPGVVRTSLLSETAARRMVVTGTIIGAGASAATRIADARTKLDLLRAILAPASLAIIFADLPSRSITADCEGVTVTAPPAMMVADKLPVQFTLVAHDPYFYDTATTTQTVSAGALALGTAPVRPLVTVTFTGSVAAWNWTLYRCALMGSTSLGPMSFANAFVAGNVLVIDNALRTVSLNGVARLDLISGGDFIALDPATMAVFASSSWPFMDWSGSSTVSIAYKKAWR